MTDHPEGQMMCGIKDGYFVHYPCRHCMAHKDEMGNVVTNSEGMKVIKRYELRKDRFLDSAKEFSVASKPQTSLGFVLDKSREIFDKIPWKYPFQIYCMTPMCILHVFLSHGIAEYAIQWTQKVYYAFLLILNRCASIMGLI